MQALHLFVIVVVAGAASLFPGDAQAQRSKPKKQAVTSSLRPMKIKTAARKTLSSTVLKGRANAKDYRASASTKAASSTAKNRRPAKPEHRITSPIPNHYFHTFSLNGRKLKTIEVDPGGRKTVTTYTKGVVSGVAHFAANGRRLRFKVNTLVPSVE